MKTKSRSAIRSIISLLMVASFLLATPAWSKRDKKEHDLLKDSSEKSIIDRDDKKDHEKGHNKVKKRVIKKVAVGAAAGAAVGIATKKVSSGLIKDVVKDNDK